jgi:hypothetical protein
MKVKNIEIPQAAIDAGNAAMVDGFQACDIEGAVGVVLHDLYYKAPLHEHFDYGMCRKEELHMRVGDRLIQNARKAGRIRRVANRWTVAA